ncbi:valine--tRNA ligase [candidate division BRC1 bacterium SM23_51]|nr:MAG: valine--tRNA ligase [candidate division BRC1 bacterium SM23_51]
MAQLGKRYDHKPIETKWYRSWEESGFFGADPADSRPPYTISIPPPNITGVLHMGHGLNNVIQDILIRWKRMAGFNALWVPGTDHASIATENVVEQQLAKEGTSKRQLGREKFIERVWQWREQYGGTIIRQLKRLGCSCDWTRERFTLDPGLSRAVRTVFKRLYDDGLIYRGNYLVNWCPKLQTVLSDDEVEYREVDGRLSYIRYPIKDSEEFLSVATTRPETMLGDTAVAVNPGDERFRHLVGRTAILPLMEREIPIIADDFVDPEFGTGMVKVTPAHDPNDFQMGRRHGLEFINILNPDGTLNENTKQYAGLDRFDGRRRVVKDLHALGLLEKVENYRHTVGHCYRTGDVVEPYLSEQWFVRMRPLAEPAIAAVREGRVRLIPKTWESTYFHWMENVRDWPISRQLWWGHRIPVWYCRDCAAVNVSDEETLGTCQSCHSSNLEQDPDALDTWFSSALWPFSTLGWPEPTDDLKRFYPTDTLVTAHEILFFWVARMIMMGLRFCGDVPFGDVYIHAMIFDEATRKKMSKSLGNIIDPLEMIEKYGADALRMTLCAYAIQAPVVYLSEKRFEGYRNFANKLWNAARFVLMTTEDLSAEDVAAGIDDDLLKTEDRWVLSVLGRTIGEVEQAFERYAFDAAALSLYHFVWHQYCDWYLELCKPRLYIGEQPTESQRRLQRNTQRMLLVALEATLRTLHPIIPFVTEEIWQVLRERYGNAPTNGERHVGAMLRSIASPSIMVAPWPGGDERAADRAPEVETEMALLQEIVGCARNLRGELNIAPSERLDLHVATPDVGRRALIERHRAMIETLVTVGEISIGAELPSGEGHWAMGMVHDIAVALPISAELHERELERLPKELRRVEAEEQRLREKLANEKFTSRAPEEVVEREREKHERAASELEGLRRRLKALG